MLTFTWIDYQNQTNTDTFPNVEAVGRFITERTHRDHPHGIKYVSNISGTQSELAEYDRVLSIWLDTRLQESSVPTQTIVGPRIYPIQFTDDALCALYSLLQLIHYDTLADSWFRLLPASLRALMDREVWMNEDNG